MKKRKHLRDKKGRFKSRLKPECESCGTAYNWNDLKQFRIDIKTCAVTHATTIGQRGFLICNDCLKEKGIPDYEYMGTISYKNPDLIKLLLEIKNND